MKSILTSKKTLILFLLVFVVITTLTYWPGRTTLVDLQKEYLQANSTSERLKVVDRVEEYYLDLSIPDSITGLLERNVRTMLDTTRIDLAIYDKDYFVHPNGYVLENRLRKELLITTMIACARGEGPTFAQLISHAKELSEIVGESTGNNYWVSFIAEISNFEKDEAIAWLKARRGHDLCRGVIDADYRLAEYWGAAALKNLRRAHDERLGNEIAQRLQYLQWIYHGAHYLSAAFGEKHKWRAANIKNYLGAIAIAYQQAETLYHIGELEKALQILNDARGQIESYPQIPFISWYKIRILKFLADTYSELNQFEEAMRVCQEIEQEELGASEKYVPHEIRAWIYLSQGKYEMAESEYRATMALTDSSGIVYNKVTFLANLGFLFLELTEYHQAENFYQEALDLIRQNRIDDTELRIRLNLEMAKLMVKMNHFQTVDSLLYEVGDQIAKLGHFPVQKADSFMILGGLYRETGKYREAARQFQKAEDACNDNALLLKRLRVKVGLASCLVELNDYRAARMKINEVLAEAKQANDLERIIDSMALLAKIESLDGNWQKAISLSNDLIETAQELSAQFREFNRLTAFRQKIYTYLKEAAIYEIQNNRIDSAFVKLDYAKAYSLKRKNASMNGQGAEIGYLDIDEINNRFDDRSFAIDYLVAQDTLYAFVVDGLGLKLLRKGLDRTNLIKDIRDYKNHINETMQLLEGEDYNHETLNSNFSKTSLLAHTLYEKLMGWETLRSSIRDRDIVYVIPDEALYDLPFASLVTDLKEPITYLIQNVGVIITPGSSFLRPQEQTASEPDLASSRVLISAAPSIPGVSGLITDLKSAFPLAEELISSGESSKKDVLAKLNEGHEIYVVVGHGVANEKYPDLSYLEFSVKNAVTAELKTVPITVGDLRLVNWTGAEHVLLIGCETAGGKQYKGTGISGLQQSFVTLGAHSVLASSWKIAADQSLSLMREYLWQWTELREPSLALKDVQYNSIQKLRNHNYYRNPHTYFWGGFTLMQGSYN